MNKSIYMCAVLVSGIILLSRCKKPYLPAILASNSSYLVVEGVINSGADSTIIRLSRTVGISNAITSNAVVHAALTVESDQNERFPLTEANNGRYVSAGLNLDNSRQYRLRIKTADNTEYLSDWVAVKNSPPIDSVGFKTLNNSLQIYVNTHDANNATRYYRWDYSEAWQFHSKYESMYISNGKEIVPRTPAQQIFSCFGNDSSSTIILGSSARLAQDVIYQNPITEVPSTSEKLETKYSILIKQYALSGDAYKFWVNLKKNTEQLGSIFDAQPSNITGNIHNTSNPAEPVIGFVSVSKVQQKRIFITSGQLPITWIPVYPYGCRTEDTNYYVNPKNQQNEVANSLLPLPNTSIPTRAILSATPPPTIIGFLSSDIYCVDCTVRGTKKPPVFWK